jgi:hypothetical protein
MAVVLQEEEEEELTKTKVTAFEIQQSNYFTTISDRVQTIKHVRIKEDVQ